jgi:hypothetical protein
MHVFEIFLPLYDNDGRRFGQHLFGQVREELLDRFGGLTAFSRSPAEGLWASERGTDRDEMVIFEVMADDFDRGWWSEYRKRLEGQFEQDVILIRASEVVQV